MPFGYLSCSVSSSASGRERSISSMRSQYVRSIDRKTEVEHVAAEKDQSGCSSFGGENGQIWLKNHPHDVLNHFCCIPEIAQAQNAVAVMFLNLIYFWAAAGPIVVAGCLRRHSDRADVNFRVMDLDTHWSPPPLLTTNVQWHEETPGLTEVDISNTHKMRLKFDFTNTCQRNELQFLFYCYKRFKSVVAY